MPEILGNESLIESLTRSVRAKHVSHSYILNGEEGVGKKTIALYFASLLNCREPDLVFVTHEKPAVIGVDDIRDGINHTVSVRPYAGGYKVYIVDEAEKMNVQAQNALLKTLEEPPEYVVILLLTNNAETFLETIRSRSVILNVRPVSDGTVASYLRDRGYDDEKVRAAVHLAGGSIGRALTLIESETAVGLYRSCVAFLKGFPDADTEAVLAFTKEFIKEKDGMEDGLDHIRRWFRDVAVSKSVKEKGALYFQDEAGFIRKTSDRMSYAGLKRVLSEIETARDRLNANVNPELTIELMLLNIRKEIK